MVISDFTIHLIIVKWLRIQKCRQKRKTMRQTENRISGGTNYENFSTWCLHKFHVCTCLPKKTLDPSWWWNCSHKPLLERFSSAKAILGSRDNYCFISINKLLLKSLESPLNDMLDFESLQHVLTLVSIEDLNIC